MDSVWCPVENAVTVEGGMEGYLFIDSGEDAKATQILCRNTTLFRRHVRFSGWRILPVGTFACWDGECVPDGGCHSSSVSSGHSCGLSRRKNGLFSDVGQHAKTKTAPPLYYTYLAIGTCTCRDGNVIVSVVVVR